MIKNLKKWRNNLILLFHSAKLLKLCDKLIAHEEAGEINEVITIAKEMLRLTPAGEHYDEGCLGIAQCCLKIKNYKEAEKYSRKVLAAEPRNRFAWFFLAEAQMGQEDYSAARLSIDQAIRLLWRAYRHEQKTVNQKSEARDDIPALYNVRAKINLSQGARGAAIHDYRLVLRETSDDKFEANYNLGCAYAADSQWECASPYFRECLRLRPGHEEAQCNYEVIKGILEVEAQTKQGTLDPENCSGNVSKNDATAGAKARTTPERDSAQKLQRLVQKIEKASGPKPRRDEAGRG